MTVASEAAIDRLLARAERRVRGSAIDASTWTPPPPPASRPACCSDGYRAREFLVMVLDGEWRGRVSPPISGPGTDGGAWAAYDALKREDWRESATGSGCGMARSADRWSRAIAASLHPPARYCLAWVDGEPRGFLSSWEGVDGVGQVEDLFVRPDARGRGARGGAHRPWRRGLPGGWARGPW